MFNKPIQEMNFEDLRNAFQILYDAYSKQSREYADLLENLDFDNLSPELKRAVNSTISEEKLGKIEESIIEQTAQKISTVVSSQQNLENAIEVEDESDLEGKDKSQIYVVRENNKADKYYYWNSYSGKWEIFNDGTIYTLFEQTARGFEFKGNVIVGGTLKGVVIEGGTVRASGSATATDIVLRTSADGMNGEIYMGTGKLHPYVKNGQGAVKLDVGKNDFDLECGTFNISADKITGLGLPLVFS